MRNKSSNVVDSQYMTILSNILNDGCYKETRSGKVYSIFGQSMKFNLKNGFPVLTTKKMFYRGFIQVPILFWFCPSKVGFAFSFPLFSVVIPHVLCI